MNLSRLITGKKVVFLGPGKSALENNKERLSEYDTIISCNLCVFQKEDIFDRIDVYYNPFGGKEIRRSTGLENILISCLEKNVKIIKNASSTKGRRKRGIKKISKMIEETDIEFCRSGKRYYKRIRGLVGSKPTCGLFVIIDTLNLDPKELYITGIDFYSDEKTTYYWTDKLYPPTRCHDVKNELIFFKELYEQRRHIITLDGTLRRIVNN